MSNKFFKYLILCLSFGKPCHSMIAFAICGYAIASRLWFSPSACSHASISLVANCPSGFPVSTLQISFYCLQVFLAFVYILVQTLHYLCSYCTSNRFSHRWYCCCVQPTISHGGLWFFDLKNATESIGSVFCFLCVSRLLNLFHRIIFHSGALARKSAWSL